MDFFPHLLALSCNIWHGMPLCVGPGWTDPTLKQLLQNRLNCSAFNFARSKDPERPRKHFPRRPGPANLRLVLGLHELSHVCWGLKMCQNRILILFRSLPYKNKEAWQKSCVVLALSLPCCWCLLTTWYSQPAKSYHIACLFSSIQRNRNPRARLHQSCQGRSRRRSYYWIPRFCSIVAWKLCNQAT